MNTGILSWYSKENMIITKSEYMMYLRHPALLWLKKHDKSKLPIIDENTQAMFDAGNTFEIYAQKLFPDGKRLGFTNYGEYLSLPARTTQALTEGTKTIFQGRFEHNQLTFICDVITVVGEKEVDLYEIKSSTKANDGHELDLAFQMVVLESLGYRMNTISVIHVNNQYVRNGDINPKEFTNVVDITNAVTSRRDETKRQIERALKVANASTIPGISPALCKLGSLKDWISVYRGFVSVPDDSIYDLCRLNAELVGKLETAGVKKIIDIPEDIVLGEKQQWQVTATKTDRVLIENEKIKEFLDGFCYPLYFLDYETLASVVPYFDGLKPYEQLPFQYSLHILDEPGSELRQVEYLHKDNTNPAEALSKSLKEHIGTSGSVITWNASFEMGCNTLMGTMLPEYKNFFEQVNERVIDLMLPFSSGWYIDKHFGGSTSIKKVLPVLVPDLSYQSLGIHEGAGAQRLWMDAVLYGKREQEKEKILSDLIAYCGLDTLAMVEIWRYLKKNSRMS